MSETAELNGVLQGPVVPVPAVEEPARPAAKVEIDLFQLQVVTGLGCNPNRLQGSVFWRPGVGEGVLAARLEAIDGVLRRAREVFEQGSPWAVVTATRERYGAVMAQRIAAEGEAAQAQKQFVKATSTGDDKKATSSWGAKVKATDAAARLHAQEVELGALLTRAEADALADLHAHVRREFRNEYDKAVAAKAKAVQAFADAIAPHAASIARAEVVIALGEGQFLGDPLAQLPPR